MALSNTAVPKYYGMFRDAVIRGEIPVCKEISMEMNRITTCTKKQYPKRTDGTLCLKQSTARDSVKS